MTYAILHRKSLNPARRYHDSKHMKAIKERENKFKKEKEEQDKPKGIFQSSILSYAIGPLFKIKKFENK